MAKPIRADSGFRVARSRPWLLTIAFLVIAVVAQAQEPDEDHEHGYLHFSHPLVTESPSPDTKIRLDYIATNISDGPGLHENTVRVEGEYAFTHRVSLSLVTPFTFRTAPTDARTSGLGDMELSLKAASLALGARGVLFGGGLSVGIPTGSDAKEIGSSHIVELEPFVDAAYKHDAVELVSFARLSSALHRRVGEDAERNLAFDFSGLYRIHPRLEALIELTTERSLIAADTGEPQTSIAPGLKLYPFPNKQIMFGASVEVGTGAIHNRRTVLLSGFYHF
ncbi:MAG TPA: hypothetical protein VGJ47_05630 [Gemmatimonadaceae bacterium]|jgi:hypothetical protein